VPSESSRQECRVWIVTDAVAGPVPAPAALEALTPALTLAARRGGGVRVVLFAPDDVPAAQTDVLRSHGATHVTVLRCADFAREEGLSRVDAIDGLLKEARPELLLAAAESATAWWPVYLAARRRLPVATRCLDLAVSGGRLTVRREALNGSAHASSEFLLQEPLPVVLTLAAGSWNATSAAGRAGGELDVVAVAPASSPRVTRSRRIPPRPGEVNLEEAELVLAGGAGLRDAATFATLRQLAALLEGAVGASRVAVDAGWARPEEQVGLTGRRVAALAYVAFGISGSREHLVGVSDVRAMVAVNTDVSAPIARTSRLFAVSDARVLLGALIAEAQRRREAARTPEPVTHAPR